MGDGYILIIAGYSPKNPDQGLLFVAINRNNFFTSRTFIAPGKGGSIRIEKAVGMRLVLKTAGQDILYFDIPGLKFVDSLEEVVPTATEPIHGTVPADTTTPGWTSNPAYPGPESTQTVAAAVIRKAILYATYLAYIPEVSTPALYPTGIFNDLDIYDTSRKLFINATNEYGGYLNGYRLFSSLAVF